MLYEKEAEEVDIVITEWALDSYLELRNQKVFTPNEYKTILRPDVELLKNDYPAGPRFQNSKFWGPATDRGKKTIQYGFKMKWHQIGPGRIQLRLAVGIVGGIAYLCRGYVKSNDALDKREMARFKIHLRDILTGNYKHRGYL
jgi:hypothetical protein